MGAWSADPFGNDEAMDFVCALKDVPDAHVPDVVRAALTNLVKADDHLQAPLVNTGVAAAALVGARTSGDVTVASRPVVEWLEAHPFEVSGALRTLARDALGRALRPDDNEWYALWRDAGALHEVTNAVAPFQRALDGDEPLPPPRDGGLRV